jgi:hypothetical protein
MLINRLNGKFKKPEERALGPDLWMLRTKDEYFFVTHETGKAVERQLRGMWPRPWIRFRDVCGSSVMLRRREIVHFMEVTAAQRENSRLLQRMLEAESDNESDCE